MSTTSLVGLSEAGTAAEAGAGGSADPGFATGDDERYREVSVVGSGGLGTVLLAHDQRLDREVALKRIGPGADERTASARFAREARITARLDHPGIVPIHDAGTTSDGRLFYTMRLIRGRSLGELAGAARELEARLALVPALTAACHAVGHAHRRGIVHRDLKPANVMVGELGETQVVDWGLADELAVLAATPDAPVVGTPAYLSPEAARGRANSVAADVWALGLMLHEILGGQRRLDGDREQVLAALRGGPPPPRWDEAVPAELRAIAEHAMALEPGQRYADGEAMAADLEAYRDGRRVRAHRYSTAELAWRAAVALRWPLALVTALVVAVVASLALTAHRTERQRRRAVIAEATATAARDRSEAALGQALAAAAVAALDRGQAADAEVLAAHALARGESPDARGVLAAATAGPRPARSERIDLPGCTDVVPAGYGLAFCHQRERLALWELAPLRLRWQRDVEVAGAVALATQTIVAWTGDGEILTFDVTTGADRGAVVGLTSVIAGVADRERARAVLHDGRDLLIVEDGGDTRRVALPCGDEAIAAAAAGDRGAWVVCARGRVRATHGDGVVSDVVETRFGVDWRVASALALAEGEFSVAIGGLGGDVELHDLRPCFAADCDAHRRVAVFRAVTAHAIRGIADLGDAALVVADDGDAIQVERGAGADQIRVPMSGSRTVDLDETGIVTGGRAWRRWSRPVGAPRRFHASIGLTVAALSPDASLLAAAGEDGVVVVWSTATGNSESGLEVGFGGVAALAFSADGRRLIVTRAGRDAEVQVWTTDTWVLTTEAAPPVAAKAAVDTSFLEVNDAEILATARSDDGRWIAAATSVGRIDVWDVGSRRLVARLRGHRQRATWVGFHGDVLWSAGWDGAILRWNTRAFVATAHELQEEATTRWHVSVDEALGSAR